MLFDSRLDPRRVTKRRQRKLMSLKGLTNSNFRRHCQRTAVMDNSEAKMAPSRFGAARSYRCRFFKRA